MTDNAAPRQLSLLHQPSVPVQFRLDGATRRRGLRHIAEIRRQMEARQAARALLEPPPARFPEHPHAA